MEEGPLVLIPVSAVLLSDIDDECVEVVLPVWSPCTGGLCRRLLDPCGR